MDIEQLCQTIVKLILLAKIQNISGVYGVVTGVTRHQQVDQRREVGSPQTTNLMADMAGIMVVGALGSHVSLWNNQNH